MQPIFEYIYQLRQCHNTKLHYLTLMGTLVLIDTCAALNSETGETSKSAFKDWFNTYLADKYSKGIENGEITTFNADECYKFRCRLLHQFRARMDAPTLDASKSGRMAFYLGSGSVHRCNFKGFYYLDIGHFMNDVISGVEQWVKDSGKIEHVQQNLREMITTAHEDPGQGVGGPGPWIY